MLLLNSLVSSGLEDSDLQYHRTREHPLHDQLPQTFSQASVHLSVPYSRQQPSRMHPYHTHPPEYPDLLPSQAYPADN